MLSLRNIKFKQGKGKWYLDFLQFEDSKPTKIWMTKYNPYGIYKLDNGTII